MADVMRCSWSQADNSSPSQSLVHERNNGHQRLYRARCLWPFCYRRVHNLGSPELHALGDPVAALRGQNHFLGSYVVLIFVVILT